MGLPEIRFTESDDYFKAKAGYCIAYNGPFGNCQNFCINNFAELLRRGELVEGYFINYLTTVCNEWRRFFAVIDITNTTYTRLKRFIQEKELDISFVVETPYINNNQSNMVICILNLNSLI